MGRMACFVGVVTLKGFRGWTGVAKAGEDEGMTEEEGAGVFELPLKMWAIVVFRLGDMAGGRSMLAGLAGSSGNYHGFNRITVPSKLKAVVVTGT